jgi:hypothetical protein
MVHKRYMFSQTFDPGDIISILAIEGSELVEVDRPMEVGPI